jgi:hypothetical protein
VQAVRSAHLLGSHDVTGYSREACAKSMLIHRGLCEPDIVAGDVWQVVSPYLVLCKGHRRLTSHTSNATKTACLFVHYQHSQKSDGRTMLPHSADPVGFHREF